MSVQNSILNYQRIMKMKNDYLKFIHYEFSQSDELFHTNSDTAILGMSLESLKGKTVLDIGTNTGALLLYAHYFKAENLIGVDLNEAALKFAEINLKRYCDSFKLIHSDLKDLNMEQVDVIICNPPFFENNHPRQNENYKMAMFEESMPLDVLFEAYRRLLKDNGEIYMIYPADRFFELTQKIFDYKFKVMKMRFVHDLNKEYASRVVLKLKKGKTTKTRILKPIMIKNGEIEF